MKSVFDIRRDNLRKLMEQWGGPTSLSQKLGHSNASYMAQLAGPRPTREVSEKTARDVERKLGLSSGWMDKPHKGLPGQPDTNTLIEVMALVQDVLDAEGVKANKSKLAELVALVYERQQETSAEERAYARRLVLLLK